MVRLHGKAPPPPRPWENAPEIEFRLFKNRIKMTQSYYSTLTNLKRLVLRESANESQGTQFVTDDDEDSIDTPDGKLHIHKIPQLPLSKDKYFIIVMYPPEDLSSDDAPMEDDKEVRFLFSFYNLYLTGFSFDEIWRIFDDAMIVGISQEARDKYVEKLGFPGNYGTVSQDYLKLGVAFEGQCDTYNRIAGMRSNKTTVDQLIRVLCRTIITLPESARFTFLSQFHLRSFHSGNFDIVLDKPVLEGEKYKNFSLHLTKWGTYSTMSKKGKKGFDVTVIPTSGIPSFSGLLSFITIATNKTYDEENKLLKAEVKKAHYTGDGRTDDKGGNQRQDKDDEDSRDKNKNHEDKGKIWFYQAPVMPYAPYGRQNLNLVSEADFATYAMVEIDRKTPLKEFSWTFLLKLAMRKACKYAEEKLSVKVDKLGKDFLMNCAKTSMSSKLIHTDSDIFANMYFLEAGALAVGHVRKVDSRHVAKTTSATMVTAFADMEFEEAFDPSFLGHEDEVVEERISDDEIKQLLSLMFPMNKVTTFADMEGEETFDPSFLGDADEVVEERISDDKMILVEGTKNTTAIRAGGIGALQAAALSVYLGNVATTLRSSEQLAVGGIAESLLITPKVHTELTLKGPLESSGMAKATLVQRMSQPLCGPNIVATNLDAKCTQKWYADTAQEDWEHHDRYPLGRLGVVA